MHDLFRCFTTLFTSAGTYPTDGILAFVSNGATAFYSPRIVRHRTDGAQYAAFHFPLMNPARFSAPVAILRKAYKDVQSCVDSFYVITPQAWH